MGSPPRPRASGWDAIWPVPVALQRWCASSRPACSPCAIDGAKALLIVELRQRRMLQRQIARSVGVSASTVSRVLTRAGLSKLSDLQPHEPVQRYEHAAPGDLLHIDTKKLGRIERLSHRVTGNRRDSVDGAGWEMLFVAVDDHARIAFTTMHPDEKRTSAVQFLCDAVAYYAGLGTPSDGCSPTTVRPSAHASSRRPARRSGLDTSSRARTARRPTARPSASSSRPCASGPMFGRTRTHTSVLKPWPVGSITTTGIGRTPVPLCLGFQRRETTS